MAVESLNNLINFKKAYSRVPTRTSIGSECWLISYHFLLSIFELFHQKNSEATGFPKIL